MLGWFTAWLEYWEAQTRKPRSVDEIIDLAIKLHRDRPIDGPLPEITLTREEINLLADEFCHITAPVKLTRPPEFMGLPVRIV